MKHTNKGQSIGIVKVEFFHYDQDLTLECGRTLSNFDCVYETYGKPNHDKSNAVLICHALSGHHHAAGYHSLHDKKPGWWENCIGPGKAIDTNKFFVVSPNNIGGCHGSTGPATINPENGRPWGSDFPMVTVKDWVKTQSLLADFLGVDRWAAVVGGSLGGMQALQWAIDFPQRIDHAIVIASAPKLSAQNIAFNEVARQAILTDPNYHEGHYYQYDCIPKQGLILARMVGHITYLSDSAMKAKFGRDLRSGRYHFGFDVEFQVESYLRHQGQIFSESFDANTYLLMTKALDYFDPARDFDDDLAKALAHIQSRVLVMSFTTDWRFAPERSHELVKALINQRKQISYAEIKANQGHDSFLFDLPRYIDIFSAYMQSIDDGIKKNTRKTKPNKNNNPKRLLAKLKADHYFIQRWIKAKAKVLDLGCGDGRLLDYLIKDRTIEAYGIEIDEEKITQCIRKGINVIGHNLDESLTLFEDNHFDSIIMTQALQALHEPERILEEMLRIGKEGIITFPNFGHWKTRLYLSIRGEMPISKTLPHSWHNTPNIHLCTFKDFENLCQQKNYQILNRTVTDSAHKRASWLQRRYPNLLGEIAIYRITKGTQ